MAGSCALIPVPFQVLLVRLVLGLKNLERSPNVDLTPVDDWTLILQRLRQLRSTGCRPPTGGWQAVSALEDCGGVSL